MPQLRKLIPAGCVLLLLFLQVTLAAQTEADSTLNLRPVAPKKNFGDRLLDVPETILKTPIYVGKGLSWAAMNGIYRNPTVRRFANYVFSFQPSLGPAPVVSYSSNGGVRLGLSYTRTQVFSPHDRGRIVGTLSTHQYKRFETSYVAPQLFSKRSGLSLRAAYRWRPRENFYGLGYTSRDEDKVSFALEQTEFAAVNNWRVGPQWRIDFEAAFVASNISGGKNKSLVRDLNEIQDKFGMAAADFRRSRLIRGGVAIDHDWRDVKGQPSAGGRERLAIAYSHGVGYFDDIRFVTVSGDIAHYFNVYKKRILAIRLLAETVDADEDDGVLPFYLKSRLGGRDDLRGFLSSRFVDNDRMLATLEYRYPIWDMIDAFIFAEAGRVFSSVTEEFTLRNWSESLGTGLRVWRSEEVVLSAQVAYSDESWRLYFELGSDW